MKIGGKYDKIVIVYWVKKEMWLVFINIVNSRVFDFLSVINYFILNGIVVIKWI